MSNFLRALAGAFMALTVVNAANLLDTTNNKDGQLSTGSKIDIDLSNSIYQTFRTGSADSIVTSIDVAFALDSTAKSGTLNWNVELFNWDRTKLSGKGTAAASYTATSSAQYATYTFNNVSLLANTDYILSVSENTPASGCAWIQSTLAVTGAYGINATLLPVQHNVTGQSITSHSGYMAFYIEGSVVEQASPSPSASATPAANETAAASVTPSPISKEGNQTVAASPSPSAVASEGGASVTPSPISKEGNQTVATSPSPSAVASEGGASVTPSPISKGGNQTVATSPSPSAVANETVAASPTPSASFVPSVEGTIFDNTMGGESLDFNYQMYVGSNTAIEQIFKTGDNDVSITSAGIYLATSTAGTKSTLHAMIMTADANSGRCGSVLMGDDTTCTATAEIPVFIPFGITPALATCTFPKVVLLNQKTSYCIKIYDSVNSASGGGKLQWIGGKSQEFLYPLDTVNNAGLDFYQQSPPQPPTFVSTYTLYTPKDRASRSLILTGKANGVSATTPTPAVLASPSPTPSTSTPARVPLIDTTNNQAEFSIDATGVTIDSAEYAQYFKVTSTTLVTSVTIPVRAVASGTGTGGAAGGTSSVGVNWYISIYSLDSNNNIYLKVAKSETSFSAATASTDGNYITANFPANLYLEGGKTYALTFQDNINQKTTYGKTEWLAANTPLTISGTFSKENTAADLIVKKASSGLFETVKGTRGFLLKGTVGSQSTASTPTPATSNSGTLASSTPAASKDAAASATPSISSTPSTTPSPTPSASVIPVVGEVSVSFTLPGSDPAAAASNTNLICGTRTALADVAGVKVADVKVDAISNVETGEVVTLNATDVDPCVDTNSTSRRRMLRMLGNGALTIDVTINVTQSTLANSSSLGSNSNSNSAPTLTINIEAVVSQAIAEVFSNPAVLDQVLGPIVQAACSAAGIASCPNASDVVVVTTLTYAPPEIVATPVVAEEAKEDRTPLIVGLVVGLGGGLLAIAALFYVVKVYLPALAASKAAAAKTVDTGNAVTLVLRNPVAQ